MTSINVVGDYKKSGLTREDLENVVQAVFDTLGREKIVNVGFVSGDEIRTRNKEYRKKDEPTDVLSFDYGREGDILLYLDKIEEYKSEDLSQAVQKTIIHGVLHLFGYDHENNKDHDIMKKMENNAFRRLG